MREDKRVLLGEQINSKVRAVLYKVTIRKLKFNASTYNNNMLVR